MKFLATAALILAAGAAQAATLSFPATSRSASVTGNAGTLTAITGSIYASGFQFCGEGSIGCTGDFSLTFAQAVMNVKLYVDAYNEGDYVAISAFNGSSLLGQTNITRNGLQDLTSFGTLTHLLFDDSHQGGFGVVYTALSYDLAPVEQPNPVPSVPAVPVPASLPLLAGALVGLAALRRRKA